jgi:hypothetical protein
VEFNRSSPVDDQGDPDETDEEDDA